MEDSKLLKQVMAIQRLNESRLKNLAAVYLERQFYEWVELLRAFNEKLGVPTAFVLAEEMFWLTGYLTPVYAQYAAWRINDNDFNKQFSKAIVDFIAERQLSARNPDNQKSLAELYAQYAATIFTAHETQNRNHKELTRIFAESLRIAELEKIEPNSDVFSDKNHYANFLRLTEQPDTYRTKLIRITKTISEKCSEMSQRQRNAASSPNASTDANDEFQKKFTVMYYEIKLEKHKLAYREAIMERILNVFYPRK